ncbi:MAG: HAD family hydrolase [Wenzhouxiangella sp.]|nr:MAG: HAD family hydrolase [Wenzhouxiangella sp.]
MSEAKFRAVLFDLDGTLVDTAPDLVATLMALRARRGLPVLDSSLFRHHASRGALGLLEAGFVDQPEFQPSSLRAEFLDHYASNLWNSSRPFDGVENALAELAGMGFELGIVTNKPAFLTVPLLVQAGWSDLFGCVISGDTTARAKPHADPVLEACRRLALDPASCLFIGDDRRDVQAGRAAGVATAVAGWGYLAPGESADAWGADWQLSSPGDLLELLAEGILE